MWAGRCRSALRWVTRSLLASSTSGAGNAGSTSRPAARERTTDRPDPSREGPGQRAPGGTRADGRSSDSRAQLLLLLTVASRASRTQCFVTAVVPAHRCGAVPDLHRVPSCLAAPALVLRTISKTDPTCRVFRRKRPHMMWLGVIERRLDRVSERWLAGPVVGCRDRWNNVRAQMLRGTWHRSTTP